MSSDSSPLHPLTPSPAHGFRIVIPIVAGIGNALLAVPMVRQLKRHCPAARITILARIEPMADVFRRLGEVEEIIVTGAGAAGVVRMIRASRLRRAEVYLVPFPSNRWQYAMLALTSGARRKVMHACPTGYWRAMQFIGERITARPGIHDVEQNLNLLRALDIEPDPADAPIFELNDDERAWADARLRDAGVVGRFIVVHAGSARTVLARAKRWSARSYANLITALGREFPEHDVVLLEGPDEAGVSDEILGSALFAGAGAVPKALPLKGPLAQAAALLERAALYVGSDSGLAHLAAAVGTAAVTLFAPADPVRVCPFGHRELVVQPPTDCTPCLQYPWNATRPKIRCRQPYCIDAITVDAVLERIRVAMRSGSTVAP